MEHRPYYESHISVSDLHQIYVAAYGPRDHDPILFIHGGPGGGTSSSSLIPFDLTHHHVILVDQRGAGRSKPCAEIRDNTTQTLIEDFETIRKHFNIDTWTLFGGSWGSTLALIYAQTHPQVISRMILRGIFLGRPEDIAWLLSPHGAAAIWPEHWQTFHHAFPRLLKVESAIEYLYQQITHSDPSIQKQACQAYARWEASISQHTYQQDLVDHFTQPEIYRPLATLSLHYMRHQLF